MNIDDISLRKFILSNQMELSEDDAKTLCSIFTEIDKYDSDGNEVEGWDGNLNMNEWKVFCEKVKNAFQNSVANKIISELFFQKGIEDINPLDEVYTMPADKTYYARPFIRSYELIEQEVPEETGPIAKPIETSFTKESPIKSDEYVDKDKFQIALNNLLKNEGKIGSRLIDMGANIVDIASDMSIDPFWVVAISIQESGWGCSNVAQNCNNLMGINDCARARKLNRHFVARVYEMPLDSIRTGVNTLDTRVNEGYETFHEVAFSGRYCAKNESAIWEKNVVSIANQLREEYNKLF